jgi:hypothetical protein
MHSMLAYYEVIHWRLFSQAVLNNVHLKAYLFAGRVFHKGDLNVAHLVCDKGAIGSAPRLRDNLLHNGNAFTGPFFMKRRSLLDPESSRTLIVLFLTYSPELMLGSGILVRSEHVFLLFSIKLVQFSSNCFDLGANFFGIRPFLDFWERLLDPRVFSSRKLALSTFWQEGLSFPRSALCNLHLFFLKMLITVTTAIVFPVFVVLFAFSSAFVV